MPPPGGPIMPGGIPALAIIIEEVSSSVFCPSTMLKRPCIPNITMKYQERDVTYVTSSDASTMPRWSIDLKEGVSGNGILTSTNPEKKWLTTPIMKTCGTICAMLPFIMFAIMSGSDIIASGFATAVSIFCEKTPVVGWLKYCRRAWNALGERNRELARSRRERINAMVCLACSFSPGLGSDLSRKVTLWRRMPMRNMIAISGRNTQSRMFGSSTRSCSIAPSRLRTRVGRCGA
mmetsp:Transcript_7404/g.17706  ORF Transcript_7404/g.17706 Transcript_7404/m.17706 type:complete len:234 (+) Transcript_7404:829-1530(+)